MLKHRSWDALWEAFAVRGGQGTGEEDQAMVSIRVAIRMGLEHESLTFMVVEDVHFNCGVCASGH